MAGTFILSDGGFLDATAFADRWSDLGAYTDSVRNVIARPGTFGTLFPETTDDHLVAVLGDALAEAHLNGLLLDHLADDDYLVRAPLASGQSALVVLFAGLRLIRAELFNRATSTKYVAGPVSAEVTFATNILRDIMKDLQAQKDAVTALILSGANAASAFMMVDSYLASDTGRTPNGVGMVDWWGSSVRC